MSFLHQFSTDFLETWIVDSYICSRCLYHETLYKYHCISVSCFWQPEGHFQGQTALLAVICYRMIQNFTCTSDWMVFRHSKFAVWLRWFGDDAGLGLVQYHKSDCHPDGPKIWYHTLTMEKMHVAKFNHLFSSLCE